ncbi:maleylpyruvate isomerase family mycothiol-dependent enzyme [Jatrophihabitans sp.]|uniref:maleylpyruvate isomerase family mycothiol-dependent enzyme n=1 Tax=Jatrophihabitans sp. TaxID=1932789 RepID=UPI002F0AED82
MYYQLYVESARRVEELVTPLDDATLDTRTPACPEWTVREMLAHLAGGAASFGTPSYVGLGTDPWAAEHVESRRGASLADLLTERRVCTPKLEQLAPEDRRWLQVVHDALHHESDIRATIGAPRLPMDAVVAAFPLIDAVAPYKLAPVGTVTVELDGHASTYGEGEPDAVVRTSLFEFWRGVFGRRSDAQMRSWVVSGDAAAFARALPAFGPRTTDLVEHASEAEAMAEPGVRSGTP